MAPRGGQVGALDERHVEPERGRVDACDLQRARADVGRDDVEVGALSAPGRDDVVHVVERLRATLGVDDEAPGQVEVSLKHGAKMLVNALGPPPPDVVKIAHDNGVLVGALVGAKVHAERQVELVQVAHHLIASEFRWRMRIDG